MNKSNEIKKENSSHMSANSLDGTIRMNINITKAFYKKIKQKALDEDITITELVIKALEKYLNR